MKILLFRCRKCGYIMNIPEKTESVLCGRCCTWNKPGNIFAALDQPYENGESSPILKQNADIGSDKISDVTDVEEKSAYTASGKEKPSKPGLLSFVAILFLLGPALSYLVAKYKLPPLLTVAFMAGLIILYQFMKKRS